LIGSSSGEPQKLSKKEFGIVWPVSIERVRSKGSLDVEKKERKEEYEGY